MITELLEKYSFAEENQIPLFDLYSGAKAKRTKVEEFRLNGVNIRKFVNEFWTSKQRQANRIHEISYRACFKPQLPNFFITNLTKEGDYVYDPFSGRGTTAIEAALLNRKIISNDVNPLSKILTEPRLLIPDFYELKKYLSEIPFEKNLRSEIDLSMFYHPDTESEIVSLRNYLLNKENDGELNAFDKWIRMVATNRLTGHSKGFFSVYTMPPNQAVLPERQIKINNEKNQKPEYRNVKELILRKTSSLIKDILPAIKLRLKEIHKSAIFLENDARNTSEIPDEFVSLTVTSPPFLDVVQYAQDNWLRGWFNGINSEEVEKKITVTKDLREWENVMLDVFNELYRVTKKGGYVAFEVGEVRNGKIKLDEHIIPLGMDAGFKVLGVVINSQNFTKTANIWGISNNQKGTNTNRIVLFEKE